MIKLSMNAGKIKMGRLLWSYIGTLQGWKPTIASSIRKKQNKILRFAQTNEISDEQIKQTIRDAVNPQLVNYKKAFVFRSDHAIVDESTSIQTIKDAFCRLAEQQNEFKEKIKAYINKNRSFSLGVYLSKEGTRKVLIPMFDVLGMSEFHIEFNMFIPYEVDLAPRSSNYDVKDHAIDIQGIDNVEDICKMVNAAGYIAQHASVTVYSIGAAKKTNWSTAYYLKLQGANRGALQSSLSWFTTVENQDARNLGDERLGQAFHLTARKEVGSVMNSLGLGELFSEKVNEIKSFEIEKGLKEEYNEYREIKNYKERGKSENIDLSEYKQQIFKHIYQMVSTEQPYVRQTQESNIDDIDTFVDFSFSEGVGGTIFNEKDAQDVVEMSSSRSIAI